jgi:hypothetical protein
MRQDADPFKADSGPGRCSRTAIDENTSCVLGKHRLDHAKTVAILKKHQVRGGSQGARRPAPTVRGLRDARETPLGASVCFSARRRMRIRPHKAAAFWGQIGSSAAAEETVTPPTAATPSASTAPSVASGTPSAAPAPAAPLAWATLTHEDMARQWYDPADERTSASGGRA